MVLDLVPSHILRCAGANKSCQHPGTYDARKANNSQFSLFLRPVHFVFFFSDSLFHHRGAVYDRRRVQASDGGIRMGPGSHIACIFS
jgi:hypothetical protein